MIQVAIDGPAGCGKSSTAREVAKRLNFLYVDSGAMYRAVTYYLIQNQIDESDPQALPQALSQISLDFAGNEIVLNGKVVEPQIRSMEVSNRVSQVASQALVREFLVAQQRLISQNHNVIMDGRDIGTVVFPEALVKIYMVADSEVRAKRRQDELLAKGEWVELNELKDNLEQRDFLDSHREIAPLRKAESAVELDTTKLTFDEQVHFVVSLIKEKISSL
jgi:cytidylate kinase